MSKLTVGAIAGLAPGLGLCLGVTLVAEALQAVEERELHRPWLEALVLAILIGTAIRAAWAPSAKWHPGIAFGAKTLLEVAVTLLGASISFSAVAAVGPALLIGIAAVVVVALATSYGLCRALGLPRRLAILVACGNSICGNSAIAAVAPVIGADGDEIASSIAFTAVLGVIVVLALPALAPLLGMSQTQYGTLAGLTVYAVPQVLAATLPIGALSNQVGTLVKLIRVLMLGPVVLALSLVAGAAQGQGRRRLALHHVVPWFILGFLVMAGLRSVGALPAAAVETIPKIAGALTVVSMAALGLGVDVKAVARAGARVTAAVTLSLVALGGVSLLLIHLLRVE
jgi:uncharacterized integral membrane protein (TIGR00698 family)